MVRERSAHSTRTVSRFATWRLRGQSAAAQLADELAMTIAPPVLMPLRIDRFARPALPTADWRHQVILLASSMSPSPSPSSPRTSGSGTQLDVVGAETSGPAATAVDITDGEGPDAEGPDGEGPDGEATAPEPKHPSVEDMAQLVAEHSDAVYRVALSVTRNPVLAEDVSQDALIKAWQALPSYRGEAPLRNWILRITHNTAVSALRKRREEIRDPNELPERFTGSSTETQVQNRLAIDRFTEALDELDETSRSIVVLREIEGLSYDEICSVLKLSLPTVKTRLLRARRQLANALDGWRP